MHKAQKPETPSEPEARTPRFWGYCRASYDPDDIQNSVGYQRDQAFPEFAIANEIVFSGVFMDNHTSSKTPLPKRPGGANLLAATQAGDHVVVTKLDRMFRSTLEFLQFDREWAETGVHGHSIRDGGFGAGEGDAMSRAMMQMRAVFAELERAMNSERTTEGMAQNRIMGRRNSAYAGIGFMWERRGKKLYRVPNESERDWCRWMLRQYEASDKNSAAVIAKHLESHGILRRCLRRNRKTGALGWKESPWNARTILRAIYLAKANWLEGDTNEETQDQGSAAAAVATDPRGT